MVVRILLREVSISWNATLVFSKEKGVPRNGKYEAQPYLEKGLKTEIWLQRNSISQHRYGGINLNSNKNYKPLYTGISTHSFSANHVIIRGLQLTFKATNPEKKSVYVLQAFALTIKPNLCPKKISTCFPHSLPAAHHPCSTFTASACSMDNNILPYVGCCQERLIEWHIKEA